jgi:hypothetical protein
MTAAMVVTRGSQLRAKICLNLRAVINVDAAVRLVAHLPLLFMTWKRWHRNLGVLCHIPIVGIAYSLHFDARPYNTVRSLI